MSNQLTEVKKFLNDGKDLKQTVADNYIEMIMRKYPDIQTSSLINHINLVNYTGANPFNGQVHFVAFFDKRLNCRVGSTVFSYRFFEDRANQTGEFKNCTCEIGKAEYFDPNKGEDITTLRAVATAYRKDREPVEFVAWYPEFKDTTKPLWRTKPHTMLRKCAIAGALRSAFPETLGNMYIGEEIGDEQQDNEIKIVQNEIDVKTAKEEAIKEEEMLERIKTSKQKAVVVEGLTGMINNKVKGMELPDKVAWMQEHAKVDSVARLKEKTLKELREIFDHLYSIRKEPIVLKDRITTDELPFD